MEKSPKFAAAPEGITYSVALGALLVMGLLQLGAWAWITLPRPMDAPVAASMDEASTPERQPEEVAALSESRVPPLSDLSLAIPEDLPGEEVIENDEPQLTPEQFVLRTALENVQMARSARKRGDMDLALNKLREAQALVPDNAEILSEMATTYETMGLFDKSSAHWALIQKLGPEKAGMYYKIASEKLAQGAGGPVAGDLTVQREASVERSRANAKLLIDSVQVEKKNLESGGTNVDLVLALKATAIGSLEIRDVKIQVYFYDALDGQHVVLTNADVSSEWQTPPPDWRDGEVERLSIHYHQEGADLSLATDQERREYLGYIVRVYYKGNLQDSVAEPRRLLELFPPPESLAL